MLRVISIVLQFIVITVENKAMTKKPAYRRITKPKDQPTPEQQKKHNYTKMANGAWRNNSQLPLDTYLNMKRGGINRVQHQAGEKLYSLFVRARIENIATPGLWYMGQIGGGSTDKRDKSDYQWQCYEEASAALRAVQGIIGRNLVEQVCCYGRYLKDINIHGYDRPNERMCRFRESLDDLVDHFHLPIPDHLKPFYLRRYDHAVTAKTSTHGLI